MTNPPRRTPPLLLARLALVFVAGAALVIFALFGPARQDARPPVRTASGPVVTWDGQMGEFLRKSAPGVTAAQVGRETDRCRAKLAARGIVKSRLEVLSGANALVPPGGRQPKGPQYTFALYAGTFALQIYAARQSRAYAARQAQGR